MLERGIGSFWKEARMTFRPRWWTWALALLVLAEGAALGALLVRSRWQHTAEGTPVQRGRRVAERMGCFGCHGPSGAAGIPNPGIEGTVPAWSDGTWMMYNDKEEDVRAWIVDGRAPGTKPAPKALLQMPAYKGRLSDAELDDLTAYVLTEMRFGDPGGKATEGRDAAQRLGCFGCHGSEGRGLVANPGSFKGYTPGWDGADYADLVQSPDEFRQWVRNGITDRFRANPAARRFVEGEVVRMPAYGDKVTDADLAALQAYVDWVRKNPRGTRR
jgi:mono/diheme cytochrome c family protein